MHLPIGLLSSAQHKPAAQVRGMTWLCTAISVQHTWKAPITRQDTGCLPYWAPVLPLLGRLSACKRSDGRPGVMAAAAKASRRWTCRGLRAACDWLPAWEMAAEGVPDGL